MSHKQRICITLASVAASAMLMLVPGCSSDSDDGIYPTTPPSREDTSASSSEATLPVLPEQPPRSVTPQRPPRSSPVMPQGDVPNDLVGTWSGGTSGATANTTYTFYSDGTVELAKGSFTLIGVAVATGSTLMIYFPDQAPLTCSWRIEKFDAGYGYQFSNLILDGYSYVRQD